MHYTIRAEAETLDIDLTGSLTFNDSDLFGKIMRIMHPSNDVQDFHEIRLNIAKLEALDSCGLDMLLMAVDCAKKNRRFLTFVRPNGKVEKALTKAALYNRSLVIVQ